MDVGVCEHVAIPVSDLEAASEWLRAYAGYVEVARGDLAGAHFVRLGSADRGPAGELVELIECDNARTSLGTHSEFQVTFGVTDLTNAAESLTSTTESVQLVDDAMLGRHAVVDVPWGPPIALVERPEGPEWRITLARIPIDHPDRAIGWYLRTLEYVIVDRGEAAGSWAYVLAPPDTPPDAIHLLLVQGDESTTQRHGLRDGHVAVACHDIEAYMTRLARRGVVGDDEVPTCGGTRRLIRDPDANPIELVERPPDPDP